MPWKNNKSILSKIPFLHVCQEPSCNLAAILGAFMVRARFAFEWSLYVCCHRFQASRLCNLKQFRNVFTPKDVNMKTVFLYPCHKNRNVAPWGFLTPKRKSLKMPSSFRLETENSSFFRQRKRTKLCVMSRQKKRKQLGWTAPWATGLDR